MDTSIRKVPASRKRIVHVVVSCLIVIAVLTAGFFWVRGTPRYSLYCFKRAILQRDAESALKYIDLDAVIDNMVNQMSEEKSDGQGVPSRRSDKTLRGIGKDVVMQNLPAIKSQLREQLKLAILSYNDRAVLEKLSRASVLGLHITRKADMAMVKVMGQDTIAFAMKKSSEGYWRIVSLNLKELM